MNTRNKYTSGFSLVELLVVLGILAILAALLFPAFVNVREKGRRATCQSNIRQMGLALKQYVNDNGSAYPNLTYPDYNNWKDDLQPYLKTTQIYRCPSVRTEEGEEDYALDVLFLMTRGSGGFRGVHETTLAKWDAAKLPTFYDSTFGAEVQVSSSCEIFTAPARHSGGANVGFVDGHVKWLTPQTFAEIDCSLRSATP